LITIALSCRRQGGSPGASSMASAAATASLCGSNDGPERQRAA
jgi:hypothetical protein